MARAGAFGILLAALLFALTGCAGMSSTAAIADPWGTISISPGEKAQIVAALAIGSDVTGDEGLEQFRGAELAIANHWTADSVPVELITHDSACSRGRAPGLATAIVQQPRVSAVIGNTCAAACEASSTIFEEAGYLFVSPGCSMTTPMDGVMSSETFARTIYAEEREASLAATFAYDQLGARRAAIVHDGTADTTALAVAFEAAFIDRGGEVVASLFALRGSPDYGPLLSEIADEQPDLIYAPLLSADGARFAQQKAAATLGEQLLVGGRHYRGDWFITTTGPAASGIYAVGPTAVGPEYAAFAQAYRERYGEDPDNATAALSFDATSIVLDAMDRSAVLTSDGGYIIGRQALRDELYHTAGYQGASGTITCTAWGDCSASPLSVARVIDGTWQVVYEP